MIRLDDHERIVFFTGAGVSVESGVPTYRGRGGLWHEYDYESYACQRAFDRDPARVWDFHDLRRDAVAACEPNEAHAIIAEVQAAKPATAVVTQNIDGLHQRAGATGVIELHGSLWRVRCERCRTASPSLARPAPRRCGCGAPLRPDIVWFEDALDPAVVARAERALAACDLLVAVGTSAVVVPAADLPRLAAAAETVEINPEETAMSGFYRHRLRGGAVEMLRRLAGRS